MELVIIDDGSTDATWSVLEQLKSGLEKLGKFERIEIRRQVNQGTCVTLNRLVDLARGEFVAMLASDDAFLPGAFSTMMVPMLEDRSVGLVVGQCELMDDAGRKCYWDGKRKIVYDERDAVYKTFNEYLRAHGGVDEDSPEFGSYRALVKANHVANGFIVRKLFMDAVMPYRTAAPLEDWWFHMQFSKIARYRAVKTHTFRYRWHDNNTIKQSKKMEMYVAKTLAWEYEHVMQSDNAEWKDAMRQVAHSEKVVFSLFGLIAIHRIRDLNRKSRVLRVGKLRWTFHVRDVGVRVPDRIAPGSCSVSIGG